MRCNDVEKVATHADGVKERTQGNAQRKHSTAGYIHFARQRVESIVMQNAEMDALTLRLRLVRSAGML